MFLKNLRTVLRQPRLGFEFVAYNLNRMVGSGSAMRTLPGNIKVTGFSGFGEYHSCAEFVGRSERAFFSNCPKSDGAVIDVGANLGIVSVILSRRFPDRPLHALEPNPFTIAALRNNLAINRCGNVIAHQVAAADHDGVVTFGAHPTNRATTSIAADSAPHAISVPCITLDSLVRQQGIGEVAFLKVDVEGYETVVFAGASELLGKRRAAVVYFEVAPAYTVRAGFAAEEPARILQRHGYRLARLDERGALRPAELSEIASIEYENWVAVPA